MKNLRKYMQLAIQPLSIKIRMVKPSKNILATNTFLECKSFYITITPNYSVNWYLVPATTYALFLCFFLKVVPLF